MTDRDAIEQVIKRLDVRLAQPARCGCSGEYAGHNSCADRDLLQAARSALASRLEPAAPPAPETER